MLQDVKILFVLSLPQHWGKNSFKFTSAVNGMLLNINFYTRYS